MRLEDVKVGMKVRVIGTLMSNTDGWNNSWVPEMDAGVGRTFEVLSVCPFARGILLNEIIPELEHNPLDYHPMDGWIFPWQVLEPVVENKAHPHAALMAQYAETDEDFQVSVTVVSSRQRNCATAHLICEGAYLMVNAKADWLLFWCRLGVERDHRPA